MPWILGKVSLTTLLTPLHYCLTLDIHLKLELLLGSTQVFMVHHRLVLCSQEKLGVIISKSSVNCIKTKYLKRQREKYDHDELTSLPHKKHGRPLVLGDYIEKQLQLYVKKIQQQGRVVTASVVVAAA